MDCTECNGNRKRGWWKAWVSLRVWESSLRRLELRQEDGVGSRGGGLWAWEKKSAVSDSEAFGTFPVYVYHSRVG